MQNVTIAAIPATLHEFVPYAIKSYAQNAKTGIHVLSPYKQKI